MFLVNERCKLIEFFFSTNFFFTFHFRSIPQFFFLYLRTQKHFPVKMITRLTTRMQNEYKNSLSKT